MHNYHDVSWYNQTTEIDPTSVHQLTNGRVKVDAMNRLVVQHLEVPDFAVYRSVAGSSQIFL